MVAINRLTGHSAGFFSVYSLPPNQAVSVESQRRINEKRNQTPPMRDLVSIILKKTRTLLRSGLPHDTNRCLSVGAADKLGAISDNSVALTVTSPPFLDIVQYADDNWLRRHGASHIVREILRRHDLHLRYRHLCLALCHRHRSDRRGRRERPRTCNLRPLWKGGQTLFQF